MYSYDWDPSTGGYILNLSLIHILGVDRLFVDEAHAFKNLFLYTKMRNVAGLSTSEAQKSSDMFMTVSYTHLDVYKRQGGAYGAEGQYHRAGV